MKKDIPKKIKRCFVCHYAEIGIKGKNRSVFERQLVHNIEKMLPQGKVFRKRGRILVFAEEEKEAIESLKKVPGIAYFSPAYLIPSSLEEIEKKVVYFMEERSFKTFRITVKRSDKSFPLSSNEIAAKLGALVQEATDKGVDLHSPEENCHVEITREETYIYFEKIKGIGGLPVNTGGKVVSLLSGGIDSPVASFRIMRRGVKNIFVHFHAYPTTSSASIEKARRIVEILSGFQGKSVLYLVPFDEAQKEIMLNVAASLRVIFYRRLMMRIGEKIAEKVRAQAIVTGESLGQVASQTIENMLVTQQATKLPVFRPLVSYDKEEIIEEGKEIGTYDVSILPEEDCCVRFLPKRPATKANLSFVLKEEKKLDIEKMVKEALAKCSKETI